MQLTEQQVLALAPDAGSASNGKKLAQAKNWPLLGRSQRALWGECQGSGAKPYQVRLDMADFASKCSCPSFKFPCKHALGLLVLTANQPQLVADGSEPGWVAEWLDKRSDTAARKEAKAVAKAEAPVDEAAQQKRAEKRDGRARDGMAALQVWLEDLVRNGLARLPAEGAAMWEQQAARMVDAQLPGLANRLQALADLPGSRPDWPEKLLAELGRMALALRAYEGLATLTPALQQILLQYLGFSVREEEVLAHGDTQQDEWQIMGQVAEDAERVRVQRTWVQGRHSGRRGLLLQFAVGNQAFAATWLPGTAFVAELAFWPGQGLRAMLKGVAQPAAVPTALWQAESIPQLLLRAAQALAANPWHERLPAVLTGVIPLQQGEHWCLVDQQGQALPLHPPAPWLWLALAGGQPLDLAVEWDGEAARPLGLLIDGRYHALTGALR